MLINILYRFFCSWHCLTIMATCVFLFVCTHLGWRLVNAVGSTTVAICLFVVIVVQLVRWIIKNRVLIDRIYWFSWIGRKTGKRPLYCDATLAESVDAYYLVPFNKSQKMFGDSGKLSVNKLPIADFVNGGFADTTGPSEWMACVDFGKNSDGWQKIPFLALCGEVGKWKLTSNEFGKFGSTADLCSLKDAEGRSRLIPWAFDKHLEGAVWNILRIIRYASTWGQADSEYLLYHVEIFLSKAKDFTNSPYLEALCDTIENRHNYYSNIYVNWGRILSEGEQLIRQRGVPKEESEPHP